MLVDLETGTVYGVPPSYYAAIIASLPFCLIEMFMTVGVYVQLFNVKKHAIKHIVNKNNVELDNEGNPIKQKATLKRLIMIAKPVRSYNTQYVGV